jgi:hypothetical protein
VGDFVAHAGSSNDAALQQSAGGSGAIPIGALGTVALATAGYAQTLTSTNILLGCVVGFLPDQATSPVYNPASTARGVWVADDPNLEFEIQDDGAATLTYAAVGGNYPIVANTGSAVTGRSAHCMGTTVDTSNVGAQLRLLGLVNAPDNAVGAYARWRVSINNHHFNPATLGA